MYEQETVINNPDGLHARPAAQFSALCKSFPNEITVACGERKVNPKSIFNLLSGCFRKDEIIRIAADGEDAERVVKELVAFINTLEG